MRISLFSISARLCMLLALSISISGFSSKGKPFKSAIYKQKPAKDTLPSAEQNVFDTVEVEASVDVDLWRKHLEKELIPVIEKAANKRMKPGQYIVTIRFLVEKDGSISDVKALNDPGYGLAKGAEKVVRQGPKWNPGKVNGRIVRSYHSQPLTFVISP